MSSSYFAPETPETSAKIFNANNLSIVASIGIHLVVLGLVLPSVAKLSASNKTPILRDVPLIELNSVEQSRLPNTSPTNSGIPQLSNSVPSLNNSLPDLSSLDPTLPPLESVSPTPSLPSLPPLPSVNIYEPPTASLPSLPRITSSYIPSPSSLSNLPAPPPVSENNDRLPQLQRPNFDPFKETLTPGDIRNASRNASDQLQEPRTLGNRSEEVALIQQRQRELHREMSESLQYNSTNTTQGEALKNDVAWMRENRQVIKKEDLIRINGTYPKIACTQQLAGKATGNVVVNAGGSVINVPRLTYSTGYSILDRQAARDIAAYRFPAGQAKAYRVEISFAPNLGVCRSTPSVSPAIETRMNPPTTPEINPKPTPSVQPQPQREASPTPVKPSPDNSTVQPAASPKPNNLNEEALPAASPKPDNLIEQPANPSVSPKPDNLRESPQPSTSKKTEPDNIQPSSPSVPQTQTNTNVEPPSPPTSTKLEVLTPRAEPPTPTTRKPSEIEPPSPPTSKKPENPLVESRNPEN